MTTFGSRDDDGNDEKVHEENEAYTSLLKNNDGTHEEIPSKKMMQSAIEEERGGKGPLDVAVGDIKDKEDDRTNKDPGDRKNLEELKDVISIHSSDERTTKQQLCDGMNCASVETNKHEKVSYDIPSNDRENTSTRSLATSDVPDMEQNEKSNTIRSGQENEVMNLIVEKRSHEHENASLIVDILIPQGPEFLSPIVDKLLAALILTIYEVPDWDVISITSGAALSKPTSPIVSKRKLRRQAQQPHGHIVVQRILQNGTQQQGEPKREEAMVDELKHILEAKYKEFCDNHKDGIRHQSGNKKTNTPTSKSDLVQNLAALDPSSTKEMATYQEEHQMRRILRIQERMYNVPQTKEDISNPPTKNGSDTTTTPDTIPPMPQPGAVSVVIPEDVTLRTIIQPRSRAPVQREGQPPNTQSKPSTREFVVSRFQNMSNWISQRLFDPTNGLNSTGTPTRNHSSRNSVDQASHVEAHDLPVIASMVVEDEDSMEATIRRRVIAQSAQATHVVSIHEGEELHPNEIIQREKSRKRQLSILACVLLLVVIGLVVGFSKQQQAGDDKELDMFTASPSATQIITLMPSVPATASPTHPHPPTLSSIRERGYIRCCVKEGFQLGLLENELCRGLAVAILGDSSKMESWDCGVRGRWEGLRERSIDIVIRGSTHTTARSIREPTTGLGFAFSSPYVYDGMVFGGMPEYVACADDLDTYFGICRRLVICVGGETTHHTFLANRLPPQHIQVVSDLKNVFIDGKCNVLAHDASVIAEWLLQASDKTINEMAIGKNKFTKEPLAMATRPDDHEWTTFVELFLQGLLEAQLRNITRATAHTFSSVSQYVGMEYSSLVSDAVGSIGNFAEVFDRTLATGVPRAGLNRLRYDETCREEGGLLYGIPFGSPIEEDPRRIDGMFDSKIQQIVNQGKLRCGIPQLGGDNMSAFHVEICKAIAAALFGGSDGSVHQVETALFEVGSTAPLDILRDDEVDLLTGIGSAVLPTLGGDLFSKIIISKPYLFQPSGAIDSLTGSFVLVTNSNHYEWSMFVHWVVNAMVVAEEDVISQEFGGFGPTEDSPYDQMFRDIISTVGNYNEIFQRTMMDVSARSGCNRLNTVPHGPQHFPWWFERHS